MINSYSTFTYFIVFFIFIVGCIYALPNLYTEDYIIFVEKNVLYNQKPDDTLLLDIKKILQNKKIIEKSIFLQIDRIQIYLYSEADQLYLYKQLCAVFFEKYSISYKKKLPIPNWLNFIKAKPIQLGLDLKGGLSIILRTDTITILNKFQEQYLDILKSVLKKKNIPYIKVQKNKNYDFEIIFENSEYRDKSIAYLSKKYFGILLFNTIDACKIHATFTKNYMRSIYNNAVQKNCIILRHRMQQLKIFDPIIQLYGNDSIVIELPGVRDITTIKKILCNTASLEFRLVNTNISAFDINSNLIPEDSEIKIDSKKNFVPLYKQAILTGNHIINSDISFDEYHFPQVNIYLDNFGNSIISEFTKNNIGKFIATVFIEYKDSGKKDTEGRSILYKYDKIINIAIIQSQLTHNFCISGINNLNEARYLSSLLKTGSLFSPIYIAEERIVGPTLGKQNIARGIIACGLGVLISICFMIIWYRYFGLISAIALIINLILIISLMSLIPGIRLTMSSIASIVLTLSVAIDANVLINERIKEEIKQGKPIQYAIYMGYNKAFSSIVDANITTIIISIILYFMGTGPIQGFAITTIIGVATSMFTSIIGTRTLVNLIYGKKYFYKLSI